VSPIRDPAGQVIGLSAIERDIARRKQGEERQRLLLAELNHRVKNTLATVLSISSQTMRHSSTIEAFAAAFEGRIQALAKAHDLLAASNWEGADLREVLLAEVAAHRERDDHLSLDGAPVSLAPNAALMLGMVFHELATNAAKYGAFTTAAGRVAVAWKSDGRGDLLKITWAERGVPKVERPRQDGFGLALIERGIAHELQGRATFDFGSNGLHCSLEIPLAEVRPPLLPSAGTRDQ
jgi:two-component sensor histidine kinase